MKRVPILFSFDNNMLMPAVVCLTSLMENAGPETFYEIFIVHRPEYDFTKSALMEIPRRYANCSVTFRPVGNDFMNAYENLTGGIEFFHDDIFNIAVTSGYSFKSSRFQKGAARSILTS